MVKGGYGDAKERDREKKREIYQMGNENRKENPYISIYTGYRKEKVKN